MVFDPALGSRALSDVEGADVSLWISGTVAPSVTASGQWLIGNVSWTGASTAPAAELGYSYSVAIPSELYLVGSIGVADATGSIDFITYPGGTRIGDFAILFIGWEELDAAFLTTLSGWTYRGLYAAHAPYMRVFTKTVDSLDLFAIPTSYARDGGGWMVNTYRRGEYNDHAVANGLGNTVTFGTVDVAQDADHVCVFAVTTGSPTNITSGDVTSPYEVVNNLEGDNGAGQASIWSAEAEIASATASHTPTSIIPSSTGTLDIDWQSIAISITEIGNNWTLVGQAVAPAVTASGAFKVDRRWIGEISAPLASSAGDFIAHRSGRETCVLTGSANSVVVSGSTNSVVVSPSENSTVSVPIDANEVC